MAAKSIGWLLFLAGLVAAGIGIVGLRVEWAVPGLIGTFTSILILLRIRAQALGRMDLDPVDA